MDLLMEAYWPKRRWCALWIEFELILNLNWITCSCCQCHFSIITALAAYIWHNLDLGSLCSDVIKLQTYTPQVYLKYRTSPKSLTSSNDQSSLSCVPDFVDHLLDMLSFSEAISPGFFPQGWCCMLLIIMYKDESLWLSCTCICISLMRVQWIDRTH